MSEELIVLTEGEEIVAACCKAGGTTKL